MSGYRRRFCFRPFAGLNRFANRSFKKLIDAMRTQDSDGNEKTAREGGRYSIAEIDGKKYVKFDRQVLSGDDPKVWEKQLRDYINNEIRKGESIDLTTADGHILTLTGRSAYKLTDRHESKISREKRRYLSEDEYALKGRIVTHIDELVQVSKFDRYKADDGHHENDVGENGFNYYRAYFRDGGEEGKYYGVTISAGINNTGETVWSLGSIRERSPSPSRGSSSNHSGERCSNSGRKASSTGIIYTSEGKSQEQKTEMQRAFEKARAKKEESGLSLRDDQERSHTEVNKTRIPYGNVSQSAENVKRENENLTTIRNLNEDDLEALYGSARIPVQELLTNTEGAGDVSLIVKNEDTRNNNAHLENMAAVIPSSMDWWLVERLKMNGLNVVEYRAGNEQARQEAEADAEKLLEPKKRFSLSPEEKVQRAENKLTAAQEKLEQEKEKAQERYKRDLTSGMRRLFNIQSYDSKELNGLLETPMLEMQQGVKLLKAEKDDLFEAVMNLGTETMPADDYYREIREALRGRRIFVPEGIREDFGDDWGDFRKKAFSSGIYFTDKASDRSVDVHMHFRKHLLFIIWGICVLYTALLLKNFVQPKARKPLQIKEKPCKLNVCKALNIGRG